MTAAIAVLCWIPISLYLWIPAMLWLSALLSVVLVSSTLLKNRDPVQRVEEQIETMQSLPWKGLKRIHEVIFLENSESDGKTEKGVLALIVESLALSVSTLALATLGWIPIILSLDFFFPGLLTKPFG